MHNLIEIMIKTTGAEWLIFINDPKIWVGETFMDDTLIKINGVDDDDVDEKDIKPADLVTIEAGVVFPDGKENCVSLIGTFRKWKKAQNTENFLVQIPKEKVNQFKALVKTLKGTIL